MAPFSSLDTCAWLISNSLAISIWVFPITYLESNIYFSLSSNLFINAIRGKYKDEKRWISREDFFKLKDTDAYVRLCWSFGNNCRGYLYNEDIEPYKKAFWYGTEAIYKRVKTSPCIWRFHLDKRIRRGDRGKSRFFQL